MNASLASILVFLLLLLAIAGIRVVHPGQCGVLFICGHLKGRRGPGNYWIPPLVARMVKVDLRAATLQLPTQTVMTRDLATAQVTTTVTYTIIDPVTALLAVSDRLQATTQAGLTALHAVYSRHDLLDVFIHHQTIEREVRMLLNSHTRTWGVAVTTMEIGDVADGQYCAQQEGD